MGINVKIPKTKTPDGLKLACRISSYLFEEEGGELSYMLPNEIEAIRKASKVLQEVAARTAKQ